MQRSQFFAVTGTGIAVLALAAALAVTGAGNEPTVRKLEHGSAVTFSATPKAAVSGLPASSAPSTVTTTAAPTASVKVETTEQAAVPTKRTVQPRRAGAEEPTSDPDAGDPSDEPGAPNRNTSSWTPAPVECLPGENAPDCLDDGLHNGSA